MKRSFVWLIPCAVLACNRPADPPAERAAGASAGSTAVAASAARDSTWIDVRGPTMVVFWPAQAQAAIDSGGDDATALDDFGFYRASADSALRALGVHMVNIEGSRFHLVSGDRTIEFGVPRDSAPLGYYLIAPGRAPTVLYGVQTDVDLVDAARQYLAGSASRP